MPGTTRSAIPRLAANGVGAITVGVNGGSTPPNVPRAFLWRDPVSNVSIPAMWHPRGYGGISFEDAVILPGSSHAIVFDWEGDNAGPPSAATVAGDFASLAKTFPGATIVASTLDDFLPFLEAAAPLLPVIENEIADTWMHGGGSDPQKVLGHRGAAAGGSGPNSESSRSPPQLAWFKIGQVELKACVASRECSMADPRVANFTRVRPPLLAVVRCVIRDLYSEPHLQFLIKNAEHTWGRDVKTWLHDDGNWTNAELAAAIASGAPNFAIMIASWQEQVWGGCGCRVGASTPTPVVPHPRSVARLRLHVCPGSAGRPPAGRAAADGVELVSERDHFLVLPPSPHLLRPAPARRPAPSQHVPVSAHPQPRTPGLQPVRCQRDCVGGPVHGPPRPGVRRHRLPVRQCHWPDVGGRGEHPRRRALPVLRRAGT